MVNIIWFKDEKEIRDFELPSPLQLSLIYNLAYFNASDGWKDRTDIKKTNNEFKTGKIPEDIDIEIFTAMSNNIKNPLWYNNDFSNLHNIMSKLEKKGIVEEKKVSFPDKKQPRIKRYKRVWRLKQDLKTITYLFNVSHIYELRNTRSLGFGISNVYFCSDHFRKLPNDINAQWWLEFRKEEKKHGDFLKEKYISKYLALKKEVEYMEKNLKNLYNININELYNQSEIKSGSNPIKSLT